MDSLNVFNVIPIEYDKRRKVVHTYRRTKNYKSKLFRILLFMGDRNGNVSRRRDKKGIS